MSVILASFVGLYVKNAISGPTPKQFFNRTLKTFTIFELNIFALDRSLNIFPSSLQS